MSNDVSFLRRKTDWGLQILHVLYDGKILSKQEIMQNLLHLSLKSSKILHILTPCTATPNLRFSYINP